MLSASGVVAVGSTGFFVAMLSKKAIDEFKQLYYDEYGKEISDEEALRLGTKLLTLFRVIYRPIPQKKYEK